MAIAERGERKAVNILHGDKKRLLWKKEEGLTGN